MEKNGISTLLIICLLTFNLMVFISCIGKQDNVNNSVSSENDILWSKLTAGTGRWNSDPSSRNFIRFYSETQKGKINKMCETGFFKGTIEINEDIINFGYWRVKINWISDDKIILSGFSGSGNRGNGSYIRE